MAEGRCGNGDDAMVPILCERRVMILWNTARPVKQAACGPSGQGGWASAETVGRGDVIDPAKRLDPCRQSFSEAADERSAARPGSSSSIVAVSYDVLREAKIGTIVGRCG